MEKEFIKAVLILPFNVLITIPCVILYVSNYKFHLNNLCSNILGSVCLISGLILAVYTMLLFKNIGKGTPAPWAPPVKLIKEGPYKYTRNPMIIAVLLILISESLILNSAALAGWTVLFLVINAIYFPLFEEKQLIKRFGDEYLDYMKKVPRWFPKIFNNNKEVKS